MGEEHEPQRLRDMVEGNLPGLPERLLKLREMQLGRGISISTDRATGETRQVGLILPLAEDQSRHLVITNDGSILVIEPASSWGDKSYAELFNARSEDLVMHGNSGTDVAGRLRASGNGYANRVVLSSDRPQDTEALKIAIDQAVGVAQKVREQQEQARREVQDHLFSQIDQFLNPPQKPQE